MLNWTKGPQVYKKKSCRTSCKIIIFDVMNCNVELKAWIAKGYYQMKKCVKILYKNAHWSWAEGCILCTRSKVINKTQLLLLCHSSCCKMKTNPKCFLMASSVPCNLHVNLPQAGWGPQTVFCIFWYSIALGITVLFAFSVTAFQIFF